MTEPRRRSRVLGHYEKQAQARLEAGDDADFQGIDEAFGLDHIITEGNK